MNAARLIFYVLAATAGTIGALGDGFLNIWAKKGGGSWLVVVGLLCWNLALLVFLRLLKTDLLAQAVVVFLVANSLVVLLLSHFYFEEAISLQKWLGIILAITAIVIMELG